jgi:hypothetical protein
LRPLPQDKYARNVLGGRQVFANERPCEIAEFQNALASAGAGLLLEAGLCGERVVALGAPPGFHPQGAGPAPHPGAAAAAADQDQAEPEDEGERPFCKRGHCTHWLWGVP